VDAWCAARRRQGRSSSSAVASPIARASLDDDANARATTVVARITHPRVAADVIVVVIVE